MSCLKGPATKLHRVWERHERTHLGHNPCLPEARLEGGHLGPTFGEYRVACLAAGATVVEFRAQADACFQPDIVAVAAWIEWSDPPGLALQSEQPDGHLARPTSRPTCSRSLSKIGALLVVDEAYWRFVFPYEAYSTVELVDAARRSQVIVLRSLTKDFALAGLRLGYAIATPDIAERLSAQLPSWNVNGAAQAAGIVALTDRTHLKTTLDNLAIERQAFFHALSHIGLNVMPSRTHFCLIEVGDAHHVRQQLLDRKILVRDGTSFGLPQFVRVATRPMGEWQQLLLALREIV